MSYQPKDATPVTARVNREAVGLYDLDNRQDFVDADRGFLAPIPGALTGPDGHTIFDPGWVRLGVLRVRQPAGVPAPRHAHLRHRHRDLARSEHLLPLAHRRDHRDRNPAGAGRAGVRVPLRPDTEAPEEMHIWIPQLKALRCAENANHTLHNIQTLRGARTRDARNFARYLDETLERWGDDIAVHYGTHTWPVWDNANVTAFLESQRDTYKYIHDQALRLANLGYTPLEAAEQIELPEQLRRAWYNRGYPRHPAPRRARGLHQGTRHLGRRPGLAAPPPARRDGPPLRRPDRRRADPGRRPPGRRGGRLPLGHPDPASPRVRPTGPPRGPAAAGRRLRAARLPDRGPAVAWDLPRRGTGAARRGAAPAVRDGQPGHHPRDAGRDPVRLRRRAPQRSGRGRRRPAHRPRVHRPRADVDDVDQERGVARPASPILGRAADDQRPEGRAGHDAAAAGHGRGAGQGGADHPHG